MQTSPLARWCGPAVRIFSLLAGYAVLGVTLMIGAEILLRRLFGVSLQGADEYGGYMLATLTAVGAAYALIERGHTRIEIVVERLPASLRAALNTVSVLFMAGMATFMAWRAALAMLESREFQSLSGTPLMTPLWIPQALWAGGMVLFAGVALFAALHCLRLVVGDWRQINRWYGIRTMHEEIEEVKGEVPVAPTPTPSPTPTVLMEGAR